MPTKVKTLYHGMIAVKNKAIEECLRDNKPLVIEYEGKLMTIPSEKINEKTIKKSEKYTCKFTGKPYWLYYFNWKADVIDNGQLKLI